MVDARNERSIAVTRRLGMELAETFTTPERGGGALLPPRLLTSRRVTLSR